jgi:imidazolonepropionase-like amidohydrolase
VLALLTQYGLSPAEALMATTRVAAKAIGIQDCTGTLAPGQWADLILVQGNPLDDVRLLQHAEHIAGVISVSAATICGAPLRHFGANGIGGAL